MTKQTTVVVIFLAALTFAGFVIVSNLVSPPNPKPVLPKSATALPSPTSTPPVASVPPAQGKSTPSDGVWRAELGEAQNLLERLHKEVTDNDWQNAQTHFAEFERKTQQLPAPQLNHPDISPVLQDFLALYRVQLSRALNERDSAKGRFAVNQLYGIVSEQRARFGTRGLPLEYQRIRFLLREVEMWNETGDDEMLRVRKAALQDAWKDMRSVVLARRNGGEQVKNLDGLLEKLARARQASEITQLLPEFDKELDLVNNLFQRQARSGGTLNGSAKTTEDDE